MSKLTKKSRQITDYLEEASASTVMDTAPSADLELAAHEALGLYCQAIATLSEKCREVFLLRKVYGLSHKEIAARMSLSVSSVEKYLRQGILVCDAYVRKHETPHDDNVPRSVSDTFLPRIALSYAASDTLNLYAQYAKGVQPATINVGAVAPQQRAIAAAFEGLVVDGVTYSSQVPFLDDVLAVDEELLTNFEVGLKGTFLDGRLNLGAALFRIETDGYAEGANLFFFPEGSDSNNVLNALEAVGSATGNGLLQNLSDTSVRVRGSVNIADIESSGLELEGVYLLGDNWEIAGQFTSLNTNFGTGCVPIGANFGLPTQDLVLASGGTMACTDMSGNDFLFIPDIQYGLAATYRDQLANGWDWFTRLDMRYEDEQYMDWFEAGWLPASTKLNLRAGVNTGNLRVELYVENLTDDRTPLGAQYEPDRKEVANFTGNRGPTNNTGLNVALAYPREAGLKFGFSF